MIFQSKLSYWTLLRPKYPWAPAGNAQATARTGATTAVQRKRSLTMKSPADIAAENVFELRDLIGRKSAPLRRARDVPRREGLVTKPIPSRCSWVRHVYATAPCAIVLHHWRAVGLI